MTNENDKQFYVGQKAFIERDGKVLVLNDPILGLDYPGGKIQEGDTNWVEALQREVREETGLEIIVGAPFYTWHYKVPEGPHRNAGKDIFLVGYLCKYVSGEVVISGEHDSFAWVDRDTYPKYVADNTDGYFQALKAYFMRG
jgi:8-oxo-dGTP diphosphatase